MEIRLICREEATTRPVSPKKMHEERAAEAQLSFKLRIHTDRQVLLLGLVVTDGQTRSLLERLRL